MPFEGMIKDINFNLDNLNISNPKKWWDVFLTCVSPKTIEYCRQKTKIETEQKDNSEEIGISRKSFL